MDKKPNSMPHLRTRGLVIALNLALLVPVPVFAALQLGTWTQVGTPTWSTNGSSGLDLALSPTVDSTLAHGGNTVEFDFIAPVTNGATGVNASTSNFSQFLVSGFSLTAGLTVTVGFSPNSNPANMNQTVFVSDQSRTGTLPDILTGTHTSQDVAGGFAVVKFVFADPSVWSPASANSTAIHVTFTPGN
jgi:hypothetical protein